MVEVGADRALCLQCKHLWCLICGERFAVDEEEMGATGDEYCGTRDSSECYCDENMVSHLGPMSQEARRALQPLITVINPFHTHEIDELESSP